MQLNKGKSGQSQQCGLPKAVYDNSSRHNAPGWGPNLAPKSSPFQPHPGHHVAAEIHEPQYQA